MSKFQYYEQCPKCLEKGRDNRGDNLAVYADGGKHCFSCGYHVFPKSYIKPEKEEINDTKVLPADFTREVPGAAWEWLLQYGLPYSYWVGQVGWSEQNQRLVFPVKTGERVDFSIGRLIEPREQAVEQGATQLALPSGKTGNHASRRKWYAWGNCHQTTHVWGDYLQAKEAVLVEDLISAHKLGTVDHRIALPLFGTRIFDKLVPVLRHIGLPLVLWLDKDQEQTMPNKCNGLAALTGLQVRYVSTELDPKDYNAVKISEILG